MKECPACKYCFPDEFNNCPTDGETLTHSIRGDTILDSRYQLDRRLGQGGMGIVYKAQHVFLKTSYAIKVILPDLVGNDPMLATRFRQEAMVAARIRHRNIVNVTDFGVISGMPYLVMDFIKGRSLHDLLAEEGRLSPQRALEIVSAVCAGVAAAHRQGVVHRDLKPLNIMIQEGVPFSEGVKVLDFGLAKIKSGELLGSFVAAQSTGLMGSPFYMAPELWSDEEPDKAVDIYSLGVIVFQILTSELPFKGPSIPSIMKKHLSDSPPRFVSLGLNLPPGIEAAVCHALAKKPQDRPASIEQFLDELREGVATVSGRMPRIATDEPPDTAALTMRYPKKLANSGSVGLTSWEQTIVSDSQQNIADEADRLALEFEEAQRRADEARKRAEEAALRRAEEEAERKRAEEEAERKRAEEEAARRRAEEAIKRQAEEEAARLRAEEEAAQRRAEERARKIAEEEAERQRVIEEAKRLAREVTEAQERAADARLRADEEASKRTEETAARLRAEEEVRRLGLEVAEAQQRAEEARQRAESEALKRAEEAEARKQAESRVARKLAAEAAQKQEEEELGRQHAAEEADRLAHEVEEAQHRAEEAGQRAETEARKRAEEEEARKRAEAEARKLAQEMAELRRRAEEARQRAESEALKRAEEVQARQQAEDEARKKAEAQRDQERTEETKVIQPIKEPRPASTGPVATMRLERTLPTQRIPDPEASWGHSQPSLEAPAVGAGVGTLKKPAIWIVLGVIFVFLILIGGGAALFALKPWSSSTARQSTPDTSPTPTTGSSPTVGSAKPELVKIEGGTFQMGRGDVSLDSKNTYDLSQYPNRDVSVKGFWMDKTEVTNAEYEAFGREETKHTMPSYWRDGKPPAGQEQWPVTGVSLDDALAFAQWRSQRDHVKYRIPTEEEWEYAARNGSQATLYPWGNQWLPDRANVDSNSLEPVGSHPLGASSRGGILDLIGNAWEWTSTTAAPYPGNNMLSIPPGQFIIRGGAFSDKGTGPENITATRRSWLSRTRKEPFVGFRLARDGP